MMGKVVCLGGGYEFIDTGTMIGMPVLHLAWHTLPSMSGSFLKPPKVAFLVAVTMPSFTDVCLRFVCAFTRDAGATCVCLRLREQCLH